MFPMAVSILGCRFVYFGLHSNSIATKGGAVVKRYFKHFFIVKCKTLQAKINLVFAESISFIYKYRNNESISQKNLFSFARSVTSPISDDRRL